MRVQTILVSSALAIVLTAGCLVDDDTTTDDLPTGSAGAARFAATFLGDRPVWVHSANQSFLPASAYVGDLPAFAQKTPSQRISGEPTIGITRTGAVFYPAIEFDQVGGLPQTRFMRSIDGGDVWEDKSPNIYEALDTHPYSFDPYVYVDPTTGRVFALDMGPNYNCNHVSWSDDDGGTWLTQYFTCPVPVVDHPSIFAGPPGTVPSVGYANNVYLCTNGLAFAHCVVSHTGGASWLQTVPVFTECGGLTGHGHASWADGTVYLPRVGCGMPQVGVSRDGGLNWETIDVLPADQTAEGQPMRGVGHEAIVATTTDGTAYIAWAGDDGNATFVSRSTDQGRTWSEPWNVTLPGVTAVKLPSLTAGAQGRIAFLYVGTETPSGHAVGEEDSGERIHHGEWLNATWNVYLGMSLDADTDDPVFATTTMNALDEPVKRGDCVGRCFGNIGGMYDFFDIDIDPRNGQVWAAAVDVCTMECDEEGATAETWQRTFGAVAKQIDGTFLLDEPIAAR